MQESDPTVLERHRGGEVSEVTQDNRLHVDAICRPREGSDDARARLALAANVPLFYRRATLADLSEAIESAEEDTEDFAMKVVAYNRLDLVENAARVTEWKALLLVLALGAEVFAVGAITRSVWLTL